jgi:hypothetical protein
VGQAELFEFSNTDGSDGRTLMIVDNNDGTYRLEIFSDKKPFEITADGRSELSFTSKESDLALNYIIQNFISNVN